MHIKYHQHANLPCNRKFYTLLVIETGQKFEFIPKRRITVHKLGERDVTDISAPLLRNDMKVGLPSSTGKGGTLLQRQSNPRFRSNSQYPLNSDKLPTRPGILLLYRMSSCVNCRREARFSSSWLVTQR